MQTANLAKNLEYGPINRYVEDIQSTFKEHVSDSEVMIAMNDFAKKSSEVVDACEQANIQTLQQRITETEQAADTILHLSQASADVDNNLTAKMQNVHDRVKEFRDALLQ